MPDRLTDERLLRMTAALAIGEGTIRADTENWFDHLCALRELRELRQEVERLRAEKQELIGELPDDELRL